MRKLHSVLGIALACLCAVSARADVVTYHNSLQRLGAYKIARLTLAAAGSVHRDTGFNASINGDVYAQPLYWQPPGAKNGLVVVATESNSVYALNEATGAIVWQKQLAPSVPLAQLPCGNIDPMGITGTPVIDPATATLYFNALTATDNGPGTFSMRSRSPTARCSRLADRHAGGADRQGRELRLAASRRAGRAAVLPGPALRHLWRQWRRLPALSRHRRPGCARHPDGRSLLADARARGGIWAQGGIAGDGDDLFVTTGNTSGATDWADGEAIIRLKPGLVASTDTRDFFTPSNWQALDGSDKDLGGTEALPFNIKLSGGGSARRIIAFGKDGQRLPRRPPQSRRHRRRACGSTRIGPARSAPRLRSITPTTR